MFLLKQLDKVILRQYNFHTTICFIFKHSDVAFGDTYFKKKRPNAVEGEVSSEIGHKEQAT